MSVQNGAMDVRQSDATGRMRLTSVFSPAHVCVHSTTQARSQDFPRGGLYSGEKWTLRLKGGSRLVKMWTFVLYPMEPLAQGGVFRPPPPPWLRACDESPFHAKPPRWKHLTGPSPAIQVGGGLNLDGWNTIDLYRVWLGCLGTWQKQGV